jgi:hypothetical protein
MDNRDRFIEHSLHTSMFFPQTRLMVAGNPKAAGTTLRWWLLAAHGIDVDECTRGSWWGESSPRQTVWDDHAATRYIWPQLSEDDRRDALESTDVLTVLPVRHPVTRAFSAWSSKYLVAEPYYEDRLPEEFARLPESLTDADDIAHHFEDFATTLGRVVDARGFDEVDVHLWPQHLLLARTPKGPVLTLRQEAMTDGLDRIADHLRMHGVNPGTAPWINETVVPYLDELVTDEAFASVVDIYRDDLDYFGYSRERPPSSRRPLDIDWLNDVRGRNGRYGLLHRSLIHESEENRRLRRAAEAAQRREEELLASTSWKVTAPLRWIGARAKR